MRKQLLWDFNHKRIAKNTQRSCCTAEANPTSIHEDSVRSLASLSGLRIQHCRELWCRSQTRLGSSLPWLWCRLAAVAPIGPLAWEPPYAAGVALKDKTKQNKKEE